MFVQNGLGYKGVRFQSTHHQLNSTKSIRAAVVFFQYILVGFALPNALTLASIGFSGEKLRFSDPWTIGLKQSLSLRSIALLS